MCLIWCLMFHVESFTWKAFEETSSSTLNLAPVLVRRHKTQKGFLSKLYSDYWNNMLHSFAQICPINLTRFLNMFSPSQMNKLINKIKLLRDSSLFHKQKHELYVEKKSIFISIFICIFLFTPTFESLQMSNASLHSGKRAWWDQRGQGREDAHPIRWVRLCGKGGICTNGGGGGRQRRERDSELSENRKRERFELFPVFFFFLFFACWWGDECSAHSEPGRTGRWERRDYNQTNPTALKTSNGRHEKNGLDWGSDGGGVNTLMRGGTALHDKVIQECGLKNSEKK